MANNENVITVRLSKDCLTKLDKLINFKNEEAKRLGNKPEDKKTIIEEGIRELYYKYINQTQDPDVVDRVSELVHDEVNSSLSNLHKKIDEVLYLTIKNDLGNKLLYRSPNLIPSPKDLNDAIDIIIEPSRWDDALEEYLQNKEIRDIKNRAGGEE